MSFIEMDFASGGGEILDLSKGLMVPIIDVKETKIFKGTKSDGIVEITNEYLRAYGGNGQVTGNRFDSATGIYKKVDTTGYSKLKYSWKRSSNNGRPYVIISKQDIMDAYSNSTGTTALAGDYTVYQSDAVSYTNELNLTNYQGEYYIGFLQVNATPTNYTELSYMYME